jgi:hypothetical protein
MPFVVQLHSSPEHRKRWIGLEFPNHARKPAMVDNAIIIGERHNVAFGRLNAGVESIRFSLILLEQIFDRQNALSTTINCQVTASEMIKDSLLRSARSTLSQRL